MKGTRFILILSGLVGALALSGCVSSGTYQLKEQEAQGLATDLAALKERHAKLQADQETLRGEKELLQKDLAALKGEAADLAKSREKLVADNKELDSVLKAKSDSLSKVIAEQRDKNLELQQQITGLEKQVAGLKNEIANLQKVKEEEVKKTSKTYEDLLEKMKTEISKGQVTISELMGKLTVNMVDAILFDSGTAEVKPEGLQLLQKVVDILKTVKDKAIRIEGHTDNVQIRGALAHKYPTNWELSAARAINVTRYLQQQGVEPTMLGSVAYGEFKPVAPNDSAEGKAKNRRIEIILVPKD
jgi:chemotaxis protein MotB